jgi:hypothetical protein
MTDFLKAFEQQLVASEAQLVAGNEQAQQPRPRRGPRMTRRRVGGLAIALALVAGPAAAAVQPWQAVFGRPDSNDTPRQAAGTPVPADETSVLAVLRRPQTEDDRATASADGLLKSVGVEYRGVRQDSVRVVAAGSSPVAIFTAEHIGDPTGAGSELDDVVCFTTAVTGTCGDTKTLMAGKLMQLAGERIEGLAPDGVQAVVFHYADGSSVRAGVTDNFFVTGAAPTTVVPGTATTPSAEVSRSPDRIQWLDAQGRVVGPDR